MNKRAKGLRISTQMEPTPTLKGSEALRVLNDVNRKPSKESKKGAKKLSTHFDKMMKYGSKK